MGTSRRRVPSTGTGGDGRAARNRAFASRHGLLRRLRARLLFAPVVALLALVALPQAAVQASSILYNNITGAPIGSGINEVTAGDGFIFAKPFVPSVSGAAQAISLWGQCVGINCHATGTLSIEADSGGHPSGTALGSATFTVSDSLGGSPSCAEIPNTPSLAAGTKYWAVLTTPTEFAWFFQNANADTPLQSTNGGQTWTSAGGLTLSLGVRTGACGPELVANPVSGTLVDDMYVGTHATFATTTAFNTIEISNVGNGDLHLTGATITGTGAAAFQLLSSEPAGVLTTHFSFPVNVAVNANVLLYVACAPTAQGTFDATLTVTSNDAASPSVSWPLECIADDTPPTLQFSFTPTGQGGWFDTSPATGNVTGLDPESGNRVIDVTCADSLDGSHSAAAQTLQLSLTGDGTHVLSCTATDVARNTSAPATFDVLIDTTPPATSIGTGPDKLTDGTSASITFSADDGAAGSGVAGSECSLDGAAFAACTSPASYSGLGLGSHTFRVRSTDVAGNVESTPASFSWTIGTAPAITSGASADFIVGVGGTFTVTTTGTPVAAIAESGTLPGGVTLVDNGDGTATLSGTAATGAAGTYPIVLSASNGIGTGASQQFSLTVKDAGPAIAVTTTATPTSLGAGGGSVTYGYTVTNAGNVPLSSVGVTDDTCSAVTFGGGDANANGLLDVGETWTYSCSMSLTATTTSTATAQGTWQGTAVTATSTTTVRVGAPPATAVPTSKPTPSPTPSATPSPTPTPSSSTSAGATPTPGTTPAPSRAPSASPSPGGSVLPTSGSPRPTGSAQPGGGSAGPSASVLPATGQPQVTTPPTSAGSTPGSGVGAVAAFLLLVAAGTLGLVLLSPRPRRR